MYQTIAANFIPESNPEGSDLHCRLCSYHPALVEFIQIVRVAQFALQLDHKTSLLEGPPCGGSGIIKRNAGDKG